MVTTTTIFEKKQPTSPLSVKYFMRLRPYSFWILLITILLFVIYITVVRRRSPQMFLTKRDVLDMMQKNDTNRKHQHRIPRLIHQTWKNSIIPARWNLSVQSVRQLNADHFEYRLWTDEEIHDFVREKEPDLYANTFLTYSYDIQRVDAFRYVLLIIWVVSILIWMLDVCNR